MKKYLYIILRRAARRRIRRHTPYIIGVTGSVGKTSCRMTLAHTLKTLLPDLRIVTSPQNFNTEIGLALALLEIEHFNTHPWRVFIILMRVIWKSLWGAKTYDLIVLEYGIDHPGDMQYLLSIAQPHISIFTGLDKVHAAYFPTVDDILAEKMQLLQYTKETIFTPRHAPYTQPYTQDITIDHLTYSLDTDSTGDIGFHDYHLSMDATTKKVSARFSITQEQDTLLQVQTNIFGQVYAGYISLAIEISMILAQRLRTPSLLPQMTHEGLLSININQQAGRYTLLPGKWGSMLIDSSYNAAPKSMDATLSTTIKLRQEIYPERDLIYCLGDMRELGDFAEGEHRKLASKVAQSADAVYLIGEWMTTAMYDELVKLGYNTQHIYVYKDAKTLGEGLLEDIASRQDLSLILFKGSQNTIFLEEAVKILLQNPADQQHLCRQSPWRIKKKNS